MAKATQLRTPVKSLLECRESLTGPAPGTIPGERLLTHGRTDPHQPRASVDDLGVIHDTSATTGRSKGGMLTRFNLFSKRPGSQGLDARRGGLQGDHLRDPPDVARL
jgi:long-chain acyl-CoA synthetase